MSKPAPKPCCAAPGGELECSCRWPVLLLFWAAAKWLVIASVLGLVVSLKCHMPSLLADSAWLTYGRLQVAATNSLLYGFGVQAALAVTLWMLVRLGRAPLAFPGGILAGTLFWNLGVCVGVISVLGGDSTGHQGFGFPASAAWILFVAYALVAVGALTTFRQRTVEELHPAQWHLLTALFWFAWIWSTGAILLTCVPVRGMMQPVVAWWFSAQLYYVFFGFVGLAVVWHLLPAAAGRPLFSRYHAMLAFWLLVLFSGWRGIPQYAAVPAWLPGLSTVAAVLSLVPVLAVALNVHHTLAGGGYGRAASSRTGWLVLVATGAWLLAMTLGIAGALPAVSRITAFTFFDAGTSRLLFLGFFGLTAFAVLYEAAPALLPGILPSGGLSRAHVGCTVAGVLLQALPLIVLGIAQGRSLGNASIANFMEASKPGLLALRMATLGDVLLVVGSVALLLNFATGGLRLLRAACVPALAEVLREQPAEVRR